MIFFELEAIDISSLNDGDLRDLVARLCEAELVQQGLQPSGVTWGGAQEAADGGLDVNVNSPCTISNPNFVPRENTGFQVKKHTMGKAACRKEMEDGKNPKTFLKDLIARKGAYIIVSGKDDCSEKMLSDRVSAMRGAVTGLSNNADLKLDFYGRDRLLTWMRRHPSVSLWVRSRLGKPLAGWNPFGRWAATPLNLDDEFLIDDHPCVIDANSSDKHPKSILEGIQLARERLRKSGSTVRITGLSGVGKTRFSQALFESDVGSGALPKSDVIYADLGNDLTPTASELVAYLIANAFSTYLVLDNCPPDVHRILQKQVAAHSVMLHLLTIEYDISDDKPEETEVIHLEPSSAETVSKLLQRRFPDLGPVNADRISEFAGGNARVGLALASRVNAEETLSNFSDDDLFQRLFSQRKGNSEELMRSAEILALVYSFNISRTEHRDELNALGSIAGLTRQVLHRHQSELLKRQLAQQRGNWRAVLPHALANKLAKLALENIPLEDINVELFKPDNFRLFKSCAHRLGYLHDSDLARELALSWLLPGAPLGNIASCSDEYLSTLTYVAPVFPEVVLSSIEKAATTVGFASRENINFRKFTNLLHHIAYDDAAFNRAVEVLLKFAESEKPDEKNNSIVAQLKQLFSLYLSGTTAPPELRQEFIRKLLESDNPRHREIAKVLLDTALSVNRWTSYGTFHFGARKRGHGWIPSTNEDILGWYVGHIELLMPLLDSVKPTDSIWAKEILSSHFRGLWTFAGCFDLLDNLIRDHGRDGKWIEIWISIKQTIYFDGDQYPPNIRARIESLAKLTSPSDPCSEIEAYVMINTWDHIEFYGEEDRSGEIHKTAKRLGELVTSQPVYLDRLGAKLWAAHTDTIPSFGEGLATGSMNRPVMFALLVESLQKHWSERVNLSLLGGFIRGVHSIDTNEARHLLEQVLETQQLKLHAVDFLLTVPIDTWTLQKLMNIAHQEELDAWRFEGLRNGRIHETISDHDLTALLRKINALNQGYISTIRILEMRFFNKNARMYTPENELCAIGREAIFKLVSANWQDLQKVQMHGLVRVIDEAFNTSTPEYEVNKLINILCDGLRAHRLHAYHLDELITALVIKYPELFLDTVFDGSEHEDSLSYLAFKDHSAREKPVLNSVPLDRLLAWCGTDQTRISKIAKAVHAYSPSNKNKNSSNNPKCKVLSEHIKSMYKAANNKIAIVQIIFENINPTSWSTSLADILDARCEAISELLTHSDNEVREMVRSKLALLRQRISVIRESEAAENHDREQRFE